MLSDENHEAWGKSLFVDRKKGFIIVIDLHLRLSPESYFHCLPFLAEGVGCAWDQTT